MVQFFFFFYWREKVDLKGRTNQEVAMVPDPSVLMVHVAAPALHWLQIGSVLLFAEVLAPEQAKHALLLK